jgi:hypothetical protein
MLDEHEVAAVVGDVVVADEQAEDACRQNEKDFCKPNGHRGLSPTNSLASVITARMMISRAMGWSLCFWVHDRGHGGWLLNLQE